MEEQETQPDVHGAVGGTDSESTVIETGGKGFVAYPAIQDVFVGESILVTGATGFLGKVCAMPVNFL